MVAITQRVPQPERLPKTDERGTALSRLKLLHSEAAETAHLANLLGRSLHVAIALPVLGVVAIGLSDNESPAGQLVWMGFVIVMSIVVWISYRHAMKRPFERTALRDFAEDLSAILLFAGFAWGAGAFLALSIGTSTMPAILFAAAPAAIIAYLLRDREALYLFLAPVTLLTATACVLQPFAGGLLTAGLVVAAAGAVVGGALLWQRVSGDPGKPAMLSFP